MANLAVAYQRGNYGLQTLVAERITKWGKPARYSEYVTGYKSADNFTGHNPDSNGIVHAVDIFVGPGNLTPAQGVELANAVVAEGRRGLIPGHPKRVTYVIHNRQIAGDFSDWLWQPYTGADPHTDHVHVSSVDLYWGDPLPASYGPADYDSTLPWGLLNTTTKPQGNKPETIQEDTLSAAEVTEIKEYIHALLIGGYTTEGQKKPGLSKVVAENQRRIDALPAAVWATPVRRGSKPVAALQELADIKTKVLGLEPVIADIAAQTDPAQIAALIPADIAGQVIEALSAKLGGK